MYPPTKASKLEELCYQALLYAEGKKKHTSRPIAPKLF